MVPTEISSVIPDTRSVIRDPGDRKALRMATGFRVRRSAAPRNDGLIFCIALALTLAACATYPPGQTPPDRLPTHGAIAYNCANGAQLMVEYVDDEARVAILGGPSMVLPQTADGAYSNGRYALSGSAAQANWTVGRSAPVSCRGN